MPAETRWKTLAEAGARINRGKRFMRREWKAGRLRGALIGGRGEVFTTDQWTDDYVEFHAAPVVLPARRRA